MTRENARITIRVKPRSSRDAIEGWSDDVLIVRLTAPPVDGAANDALIKILAKKAGVPRTNLRLVTGERGRLKVIEFQDMDLQTVRERLCKS